MQLMNKLDRLETLMQYLIEGTFSRLFQTKLNLADTAHRDQLADKPESASPNQASDCWVLWFADRRIRLGEPVVTIGRALDNDIVLPDSSVWPYHAQLRWRGGRYHLCPPAMSTGANGAHSVAPLTDDYNGRSTAVNRQLKAVHSLTPGDEIRLGSTSFTVAVEQEQV